MDANTASGQIDLNFETPQMRSRSNTWPLRPKPLAPAANEEVQRPTVTIDEAPELDLDRSEQNISSESPGLEPDQDGLLSADVSEDLNLKKTSSRKNAWGNLSYADLITRAIQSSVDKRLTLSQIYDWMVQNVPYFRDKGDSNSSAGWKNSIRHNLSLHNRFMRMQNEGAGKSSWWVVNPDARPGKTPRRRATSMDTKAYEKKRGRAKKKVEALRNAGLLDGGNGSGSLHSPGAPSPLGGSPGDFSTLSPGDFRSRASSNASSLSRLSPIPHELDLHGSQVPRMSPPWGSESDLSEYMTGSDAAPMYPGNSVAEHDLTASLADIMKLTTGELAGSYMAELSDGLGSSGDGSGSYSADSPGCYSASSCQQQRPLSAGPYGLQQRPPAASVLPQYAGWPRVYDQPSPPQQSHSASSSPSHSGCGSGLLPGDRVCNSSAPPPYAADVSVSRLRYVPPSRSHVSPSHVVPQPQSSFRLQLPKVEVDCGGGDELYDGSACGYGKSNVASPFARYHPSAPVHSQPSALQPQQLSAAGSLLRAALQKQQQQQLVAALQQQQSALERRAAAADGSFMTGGASRPLASRLAPSQMEGYGGSDLSYSYASARQMALLQSHQMYGSASRGERRDGVSYEMQSVQSQLFPNDLDLNFDSLQAEAIECDVDQVIRQELSIDGSLDFSGMDAYNQAAASAAAAAAYNGAGPAQDPSRNMVHS